MSTAKSPIFIIVPGAWHKQIHVQPLLQSLERKGYEARCVVLATVQTDKPRPTWDDEVSNISSPILEEIQAGRDVFLMLHSYAGLPGCEAVNRVVRAGGLEKNKPGHGRLRRVIFFAAHHFPEGFVVDSKQFIGPANPSFGIDENDMAYHTTPYEEFFTDFKSREEAQPYIDEIKPYYYIPGGGGITTRDWRQVPRSIIGTTKDKAIVPAFQSQLWKEFEDEIVWIDVGHTPFPVLPDYISDVLIKEGTKSAE